MVDRRPRAAPARAILVLAAQDATLDALVGAGVGPRCARRPRAGDRRAGATTTGSWPSARARLNDVRAAAAQRGVTARVAAFTSADAGADAVRLAGEEDVALLLLDAPEALLERAVPTDDLAGAARAGRRATSRSSAGAQRPRAAAIRP